MLFLLAIVIFCFVCPTACAAIGKLFGAACRFVLVCFGVGVGACVLSLVGAWLLR